MNYVMNGRVKVMSGARTYELLMSKKPEDLKTAKRLGDYCHKAEACFYDLKTVQQLRQEYSDVL